MDHPGQDRARDRGHGEVTGERAVGVLVDGEPGLGERLALLVADHLTLVGIDDRPVGLDRRQGSARFAAQSSRIQPLRPLDQTTLDRLDGPGVEPLRERRGRLHDDRGVVGGDRTGRQGLCGRATGLGRRAGRELGSQPDRTGGFRGSRASLAGQPRGGVGQPAQVRDARSIRRSQQRQLGALETADGALELGNQAGVVLDGHWTSDVETVDGRVQLTDVCGRAEWRGSEVEEGGHESMISNICSNRQDLFHRNEFGSGRR